MAESIWFGTHRIDEVNARFRNTLTDYLGIVITELGNDFIKGTMPVNEHTRQTMGIVHGGANVCLTESLASLGANLVVDRARFYCVGQEVNANHLRPVSEGLVTGIASPDFLGRSSQVWSVKLFDDRQKLTCLSRITLAVKERV